MASNSEDTNSIQHDERQTAQSTAHAGTVKPELLSALEWRCIGPFRGGRVVAVAGDPIHEQVFYFGSTGGGVWKTTNGGVLWENVSDGSFKRASVGALAVAPSDPNVIYAGMGETTIRGNVSHGDGVYRSTDAGKTWTHLGLEATRNIGSVRVHPQNPDLVYVAALGHAHGPNPERGVYRSGDGGKTWELVLHRSDRAGAVDLALDPNNPRILYATFWEAHRGPHALVSGGEGSGLFKSTDGGDTWKDISRNNGLPKGVLGKIGVAVSAARPDRVWAIVEAEDGAVFRSDDGGENWQRLSEDRNLRQRAWYYHHIFADPQDADTVWVLNVQAWKSIDGGKTFSEVAVPHGDNHDLWIDPRNSRRMIEGNDGGACVTFDGGATWSSIYNQPTCEFYHVTTDTQTPYRVYGAQQDNTTISLPNRSSLAGITFNECYEVGGGESGYIAVRPDDPNVVFAGSYQGYLTRYDHRTRQIRNITVWPQALDGRGANEAKYRFQWTYPILISPHDPNTLYVTGNVVFRSTDEGGSWEAISPDLTRHDAATLGPSGGPLTGDNTGTEFYATVFAFAESPLERGLLWAGSDDGLVHVSRDGGKTWDDVTPNQLPKLALVSIIEPSPHDPATAYVAATCYKSDDFRPYLFKTSDYGKTWTAITDGIAENDFTRAIREDPVRRGLLYAGTETGIHVSFDDGAHWQSLRLNLPAVPIHDLVVKDDDLIAATHGRAFWILDDVTPLRAVRPEVADESAHLFAPRTTTRFLSESGFGTESGGVDYAMTGHTMFAYRRKDKPTGDKVQVNLDAGQNPPEGVIVRYYLKEKPEGEIKLSFLDEAGNEIRAFSSEEQKPEPLPKNDAEAMKGQQPDKREEKKDPRVPKESGLNRFVWNLRYPDSKRVDGYAASEGEMSGPRVSLGTYQVRLAVGDQTYTQSFQVVKDPRVPATQADLDAQRDFLLRVRDKLSETHGAINTIRVTRQQIGEWKRRAEGREGHERLVQAADALSEKLVAVEDELIQRKARSLQDTLNYPVKLNGQLAGLAAIASSADAAPTRQTYQFFDELAATVDTQLARMREALDGDLAAFNELVRELGVPAVVAVPPREGAH